MAERTVLDAACWVIEAATGERYGDGYIVSDVVIGYAEPGYGSDDAVIVFGNWNPKRFPRDGEPALTKAENLAPRLADALERAGAELEWLDEWASCCECHRAMRTQADSYSWTLYGGFCDDGYVCADCMANDPEAWLADYVNDSSRAITWVGAAELEGLGFVQWAPGDPREYESGWHPGQDDDPAAILAAILEDRPDAEVVFLIDGVGQFDCRFSAFVREAVA